MKKLLFFLLLSMLAIGASAQRFNVVDGDTVYVVQNIDQDQFKELIADWGAKDWVMRSERPAIIDFAHLSARWRAQDRHRSLSAQRVHPRL